MKLLYFIIISITLGILLFVFKLGKVNFKYFKENYKAFLSYICILLIVFVFLASTFKCTCDDVEMFINNYILFMLSCGISIILVSPIIALIQKNEEKKIVNNYEKQYKIEKFYIYRDLIGDICPAILFKLYNKNKDIEDLVVASYIYMLRKQIIKIEDNKIVVTGMKINYSHEKKLLDFFTKKITKKEMENSIMYDLIQDMKNDNFIYDSNKKIDFTESMQLIIVWLIITLLIMMPAIVPIGFNGLYLVIAYITAFIAIPIYQGIIKIIHPILKSKKSLQIVAKLNGLRKFYNEFNIVNDKSINEIELYDDYILYGIIFSDKGNLNNEVNKLYKKICT